MEMKINKQKGIFVISPQTLTCTPPSFLPQDASAAPFLQTPSMSILLSQPYLTKLHFILHSFLFSQPFSFFPKLVNPGSVCFSQDVCCCFSQDVFRRSPFVPGEIGGVRRWVKVSSAAFGCSSYYFLSKSFSSLFLSLLISVRPTSLSGRFPAGSMATVTQATTHLK